MSLKGGAGITGPSKGSFLRFGCRLFVVRTRNLVVEAVGMWESRSDFQGRWEEGETVFGFPRIPRPVISTAFARRLGIPRLRIEAAEQFMFGLLHATSCFGVTVAEGFGLE
jgi:hypothetical protein